MEAKMKSRKRKCSNSSSYGVVTRSRLRLKRGSDDLLLDSESVPTAGDKGYEASEGPIVGNASPFASVKDLRVHRIYSPVSVSTGSLDGMEKDAAGDYSLVKDRASGALQTEADLNRGPSLEGEKTCDASVGFESNASGLGQNGGSEELEVIQECVQSTPPDAVLGETKIVDPFEKSDDPIPESYMHSRVLKKPCFRPKLFGNPSSFNYKRLFSYLMDMKGPLKSIDMKLHQPNNAGSSVLKRSQATQESNLSCRTEPRTHPQVLSPSRTSDPTLICTMNTADTEIPGNYSLRDPEVYRSLSYYETKVSTKVAEVLDGIATGGDGKDAKITVSSEGMNGSSGVHFQQSPVGNGSELTHVLSDALSYNSLSLADDAAEKNGINKDETQGNMSGKNSAEFPEEPLINYADAPETPPSDYAEVLEYDSGLIKCISKPEDLIEDGLATAIKNSDHEEASTMLPNEAICGPKCINFLTQQSPDEYRTEHKSVLGDSPSCKHLELIDVHATDKNGVDYDKPQTGNFGQTTTEFVQEPPPSKETGSNVIGTIKHILKPERQTDDGIVGNRDNIDRAQFIVSEDRNLSPERKLNLKTRRPKIFKHHSVSYRRMLPYLTEIFRDSTYPSSEGRVKKVEVAVQVGDSETKNQSTDTSVRGTTLPGDSSPVSASCVLEPVVTNYDQSSGSDAIIDSSTESQMENRLKSSTDLQITSHGQGPSQHIHCSSSSGSDNWPIAECMDKSQCAPSNTEEDLTKNKHHSGDLPHLKDSTVHPEPIIPLGTPFVCPTRGILKRNPRGCRGLCTCLSCASFRIHAEKAFDFSRNQLLDSEEIALELINELSFLRNLLKKSADDDSGKTRQVQVQEACMKAYTIEQQAKARFEEMHRDLNIHCKIPNLQRPRVSFVRHFEGKSAHLPAKQRSRRS